MCKERYLSKLLPDVLRKLETITLWPAAKSPVTLSIVQRRKEPNILLQPSQILPRSTCCWPLEITNQGHWPQVRKACQTRKKV